jgi:hypothetical protein
MAFTLAFLFLAMQAFRGRRIPFLGLTGVLAGLFCFYHLAAGTVAGARGVDGIVAVRVFEAGLGGAGLWLVVGGVLRLAGQRRTRRVMNQNGERGARRDRLTRKVVDSTKERFVAGTRVIEVIKRVGQNWRALRIGRRTWTCP